MRKLLTGMLFAALVAAAGCKSKPAATCENAAEHAIKLMLDSPEMAKASPEQKTAAETMVKGLKDEIIKECKDKKWDQKQLDCVVSATKMDEVEKCETAAPKK
jgi:small lipoprotein (TIGR04454 family)